MQAHFRILRFNPETDTKPHFEEYDIEIAPDDRVLDGLNQIKWYHDGSLAYRRSCAHGVCGSDAMRINGRNRLACKMLMQEVGERVTIEPLIGFKVLKDLIVDFEPFFESYRSVKPYLINDTPPPTTERLQSQADREKFDDTTKCILCACCTTACPPFWANKKFVGPASIVNAHRFIFDSRDEAQAERLAIMNETWGVWRCRTVFNCTEYCPRDIEVTKAIGEIKRLLLLKGFK